MFSVIEGRVLDAIGFMDTLLDRLLQYAGSKDIHQERSILSNRLTDDYNRGSGQMMDETQINIDVTIPGAIIALGLIFLKKKNWSTACSELEYTNMLLKIWGH